MKLIVEARYHFQQDSEGIDEGVITSEIRDVIGLLDLGIRGAPEEQRAIIAMTQGFTIQQLEVFDRVVSEVLQERRKYHSDRIKEVPESIISKAVLQQCDQIEHRWGQAREVLGQLIDSATTQMRTGLEPSRAQREGKAA